MRALADPNRTGPTPFSCNFFGKIYRGDLSYLIDWSVYMFGAYAPHELMALQDAAAALPAGRTTTTFYDVGANVGQHSLFMSSHVGRVMAFEPFDAARDQLKQKIADNKLNTIEVFPIGLGSTNGPRIFHVPTTNNIGKGSFDLITGLDALEVMVRRGDDLIAEQSLPRIDILKIDVEGFEAPVFEGLHSAISRDRPVILTEISGNTRSGFGSLARFRSALYPGATIFDLQATRNRDYRLQPVEFDRCDELLIVPEEMVARMTAAAAKRRKE